QPFLLLTLHDRDLLFFPYTTLFRSSRWPMAGVSSDGLNTTVFPSSKLGPSIHKGTAKGKFQGVITATTPQGLRRMKASFSAISRSEEHTSELQSRVDLVCRLLLEKK